MRMLLVSLTLLLALAAFGALAHADEYCADELGCVEIGPDDKIVIGGLLRLSGPEPWTGKVAISAFELATLARGGTLLGREIELVLEDSACSEEQAREAAQRLAANPAVVGVIGANCSLATKGALPVISAAGLLMISPSNTSPFLTECRCRGRRALPAGLLPHRPQRSLPGRIERAVCGRSAGRNDPGDN